MIMKQALLQDYAQLIVRVGANIQPGQGAVIYTAPQACDFVPLVAREAYEAGAAWVQIHYDDVRVQRLGYEYGDARFLKRVPAYERERQRFLNRELPCEIYLLCDDPEALAGVDESLLARVRAARSKVIKPLRDARENKNQWTIAAVPCRDWAVRVFPTLSPQQAVEKLWMQILTACRVQDGTDALQAWQAHHAMLAKRSAMLNAYEFCSLHLKSTSTGTDLHVALIDGALWLGGAEKTASGVRFEPNLPTEEIFTTPLAGQANGRVRATKPLALMGQVIRDFELTFEQGRVVSCRAAQGQALLEKLIALDENAGKLGEVALIGADSPIHQMDTLFYETLFDENASCHLALGAGFTNVLPDYAALTHEQACARGVNDSVHHTDFMIGAPDLSVTGRTRDGVEVCVFRDGNWVI